MSGACTGNYIVQSWLTVGSRGVQGLCTVADRRLYGARGCVQGLRKDYRVNGGCVQWLTGKTYGNGFYIMNHEPVV